MQCSEKFQGVELNVCCGLYTATIECLDDIVMVFDV